MKTMLTRMRCGLFLSLSSALAACGGEAPPPTVPATLASAPPPATEPPAPTTEMAASPVPPPRPTSPFHVYADLGESEPILAPMGNKGLLAMGRNLFLIDGDKITADPSLLEGITHPNDGSWLEQSRMITGAFGEFPDNAYVGILVPGGRVAGVEVVHWEKDRWKSTTSAESMGLGGVAYVRGTTLGVLVHPLLGARSIQSLGHGRAPIDFPKERGFEDGCYGRHGMGPIITLADGTVVGAGALCEKDGMHVRAVVWAPKQRKAGVVALPGMEKGDTVDDIGAAALFAVDGGAELWMPITQDEDTKKADSSRKDRTYAARFDGKTWTAIPATMEPASGFSRTSQGTIWMTGQSGALLRRTKDGTVETVVLPEDGMKVSSVWARSDDDVWALATVQSKSFLLHTRANPVPGSMPTAEAQTARMKTLASPRPLTAQCPTPFVFLFAPTKVAPADYDYPLTRKALKGHKEYAKAVFVEWKVGEKRFFGAKVETPDQAKSLTALIAKELKGASPQAVCHDPQASRTLAIDLATGELIK